MNPRCFPRYGKGPGAPMAHRLISGRIGTGQDATKSYAAILRDDYNADEVWPLVDIAAGVTIPALVNSDRNGTLQGWNLQNTAGPVTGTLAPYSDGANDYGNILTDVGTTGLKQIFNGTTGSAFVWGKVVNVGAWTDGAVRNLFRLEANATNYILLTKSNTNNRFQFLYFAGATLEIVNLNGLVTTDWFSVGMSWDKTAGASGEVKAIWNGAQTGATQTGLGVWAGALTKALIGAETTVPVSVWDGWMAYAAVKFGSVWSPADFLAMHNAAATSEPDGA